MKRLSSAVSPRAILCSLSLFLGWSVGLGQDARATDKFREVYKEAVKLGKRHGPENVLLVFDIDNTLLAMRQDLGSDQWFGWQEHLPAGDSQSVGDFNDVLNVQGLLFAASSMRPTHKNQPALIEKLQKAGFPALLLTSRGYTNRDATRRELNANGYDFSASAPSINADAPGAIYAAMDFFGPYLPYDPTAMVSSGLTTEEAKKWLGDGDGFKTPRKVSYSEGVYMTAGQHKGVMLRLLLYKLGWEGRYKAILFADDLKKHTERMQDAFANKGIEVVTFHYGAEDENVEAFAANENGEKEAAEEAWNEIWSAIQDAIVPAFELPVNAE
jgi:hypothetical protein